MDRPIDFDDQPDLMAVKIDDETSDDLLPGNDILLDHQPILRRIRLPHQPSALITDG
jgi:hypothetical protein